MKKYRDLLIILLLLYIDFFFISFIYLKLTDKDSRFDEMLSSSTKWLDYNNENVSHVEKFETFKGAVSNVVKSQDDISFNIKLQNNEYSDEVKVTISKDITIPYIEKAISNVDIQDSEETKNIYPPFKTYLSKEISLIDFINELDNNDYVKITYKSNKIFESDLGNIVRISTRKTGI